VARKKLNPSHITTSGGSWRVAVGATLVVARIAAGDDESLNFVQSGQGQALPLHNQFISSLLLFIGGRFMMPLFQGL
jgi:hypothetical protein